MLRVGAKDVATTVGWAIVIASIVSQALYVRVSLIELDLILLFLTSVVAGSVVADLETLIASFLAAMVLGLLMIYSLLTLPSILKIAGVASGDLYSGAILMIFRNVFPIPLIIVLFGGLLGSFVGERLRLR